MHCSLNQMVPAVSSGHQCCPKMHGSNLEDISFARDYYILYQEFPKAQDKSLGRRSWALPKTCNFRSWALSWAQSTKNDTATLTTFLSGLVPKTSDTPLERFNHLNYFETWSMPVRPCCLTAGIVVRRLLCEAIK